LNEKLPVSVIVLTKNEEAGIALTLSKLRDFEEVIVVDSHSTDSTVEIARSRGARIVEFTWNGEYPKKKQWSLDNAGALNKWVLLLDADEYPSPELVDEISALHLGSEGVAAYNIPLAYRFGGRILRFGHRVTKRSLLDIDRVRFPNVNDLAAPGIREVEGHYQPQSSARIATLRSRIVHDDRDPISTWFSRHNRYSDWEAHLRMDRTARSDIASKRSTMGSLFDRVPAKPLAFFVYSYLARGGVFDGRAGFDYAFALSAYYWQIGVKYRELQRQRFAKSSGAE
jgi:glycosyltransferase involved in cell wall biosynthesis